jgi:hypothetical protein
MSFVNRHNATLISPLLEYWERGKSRLDFFRNLGVWPRAVNEDTWKQNPIETKFEVLKQTKARIRMTPCYKPYKYIA